jgi:phosphatidylinositol alpha-1,6-mannosyltransferase
MAAGTPVVTGDAGDRRLMLGDGQAGVLVLPGSAPALAEGIVRVLRDNRKARSMQQAAERLREQYYWDVLVRDFVHVYDP